MPLLGLGKKLHNGKFHIDICLMRYLGYLFRNSHPCEYIPKFFRPKMKTKQPTLHYYPSSDQEGQKMTKAVSMEQPSWQRYTYRVFQTIQMKLILLWIWAEQGVLGRAKTVLKFKYEI